MEHLGYIYIYIYRGLYEGPKLFYVTHMAGAQCGVLAPGRASLEPRGFILAAPEDPRGLGTTNGIHGIGGS